MQNENNQLRTDIPYLLDLLNQSLAMKAELEDRTKENNRLVEDIKKRVAEAMIEQEIPQITHSGYSFTLQAKTRYSSTQEQREALFDALRDNGLGDLIQETVNAQTLQAAMTREAADNDGELPEQYRECVNRYDYYDIGRRKQTAKK